MKTILGVAALAVLAAPVGAAPVRWSSGFNQGIQEYSIGAFGSKATNLVINCPVDGVPTVMIQIDGALPPPNEQVGFKAAGRTFAIRAGGSGDIKIDSEARGASFVGLWRALRAGKTIDISYTDGRHATLPLTGSAKVLPARTCGSDYLPNVPRKDYPF